MCLKEREKKKQRKKRNYHNAVGRSRGGGSSGGKANGLDGRLMSEGRSAGNGGHAAGGRHQASGGGGEGRGVILLATLAQDLVDSGLSGGHFLDGARNGDRPIEAERVHVVDTGDGYPRVGFLFDIVDDAPVFADDSTHEIVMSQNLEAQFGFVEFFPFVLHHFQDLAAGDRRAG